MKTALVISNDPGKSYFFKKELKGVYSILEVENEEEGLKWIQTTSIEIIFLDYLSIEGSLTDFCAKTKALTLPKNIPILLISPMIKKSFSEDAIKAGVSDFLHEPLHAEELHERIAVQFAPPFLNKKVKNIRKKIKPTSLIPKNTTLLLDRTLIRDVTLKKIVETKKTDTPLCVFTIHLDSMNKLKKEVKEHGLFAITEQLETLLKLNLRQRDFLITESPGQYLLLLPRTSPTAGKIIAEEIRREVSSTPLVTSTTDILVTVSIGVISFGKELSTSAESFDKFEFCLEKVKKSLPKNENSGNIVITD
jgi:PleD family two-component response regulator